MFLLYFMKKKEKKNENDRGKKKVKKPALSLLVGTAVTQR